MKKLGLVLLALIAFNTTTYAAKKGKADTAFTFQNFVPTSADVVKSITKTKSLGSSTVAYPLFTGSGKVSETMNKEMEKFIKEFNSTKSKSYKVTYTITGSNSYFVSVLFDAEVKDLKSGTTATENKAISFNAKNGKALTMKDIFVSGYEGALNEAVNDKIKQFGIDAALNKRGEFEGVTKRQQFYMEDDAIVLFYDSGKVTGFADGKLFIPFMTTDLIGIIK